MPTTAAERGLLDPFDPVQALPKAAQFLRELKDQFGNLGLAAAAYNAGPARVRGWLAGARSLSLPKTTSERIDGVVRQGSDTQQCSRSARSVVYKARPCQAKT
jgi:soluble lytic murein transglycosylase-like protein